jgi:hypothetical protein
MTLERRLLAGTALSDLPGKHTHGKLAVAVAP